MRPRGVLSHLRSEAGFALIDVMVGVVIVALTLGAIVGVSSAVSTAVVAQTTAADRLAFVNSFANDLATHPADVSATVTTSPQTVTGVQVTVAQVRVTPTPGQDIIRVAAPRGDAYDCTPAVGDTPTTDVLARCVVAEVSVDSYARGTSYTAYPATIAQTGIDGATPTVIVAGTLATFTAPSDGQVKFVMGAKVTVGAGRLVFYQGVTPAAYSTLEVTESDKYLVQTLTGLTAGQSYTVSWEPIAGTTATAHHFLLYK